MDLETEDGLRQALRNYADTTTTSPDAWDRTLERADRRRSRKRMGFSIVALTATASLIAGCGVGGPPGRRRP
jgi:hypothetical protein